jgi:hypothetical protein
MAYRSIYALLEVKMAGKVRGYCGEVFYFDEYLMVNSVILVDDALHSFPS